MQIIRLTRAELLAENPCDDGLQLFDKLKAAQDDTRASKGLKPRRCLRLRWTIVEQLWFASAYPSYFGWLCDVGLLPRVHAKRGANLSGADLYGANLSGANLYGADLSRANLSGANLYGADLSRASLDRADLYGASLDGANLSRASLDRANLYGANLYGANLSGANLSRANLYGARNWPASIPIPAGFKRNSSTDRIVKA